MSRIRQHIAGALHANDLTMSPIEERAIDRIAALSQVGTLGSAVLRLRYGHDADAYRRLRPVIAKKARRQTNTPENDALLDRLAHLVLREWLDDRCQHCHGRTWVQRGARRQACRPCGATGGRVVRDIDRALALQLPVDVYAKHWAKRVDRMLDVLRSADARAVARLQTELEKRTVRANITSQPSQSAATPSPHKTKNMGDWLDGVARPEDSESPLPPAAGFVVSEAGP